MYHCIYIANDDAHFREKLAACHCELEYIHANELILIYQRHQNAKLASTDSDAIGKQAMAYQQLTKKLHKQFEGIPLAMDTTVEVLDRFVDKLCKKQELVKAEIHRIKNTWEVSIYFTLRDFDDLQFHIPDHLNIDKPGVKRMKKGFIAKKANEINHQLADEMKQQIKESLDVNDPEMQFKFLPNQQLAVIHCHLSTEKIQLLRSNWISIKLSAKSKKVSASGPWPPFHFISLTL